MLRRSTEVLLILGTMALAAVLLLAPATRAAAPLPDPATDAPLAKPGEVRTAVFAGGCFWGVEAVFKHTRGVLRAASGYAGGTAQTATYEQVSSGTTRHAESVQVTYDASRISYGQLLKIFFSVAHDPTELNRQGPDVGPQYRSAVFAVGEEQQRVARSYIAQLDAAGVFRRRIATDVAPLERFYEAEPYHQDYVARHPNQPYIVMYDRPKLAELKRQFPALYVER